MSDKKLLTQVKELIRKKQIPNKSQDGLVQAIGFILATQNTNCLYG